LGGSGRRRREDVGDRPAAGLPQPLQLAVRARGALAAVRRWLATNPPKQTTRAYDDWAREYNYALRADSADLPLPRLSTVRQKTALRWRDIVAIAKGECEHPEVVVKRRSRQQPDSSRGVHDLIGLGTIALLTGRTIAAAGKLVDDYGFPRPALVLGHGRRAWLRDEVESYLTGERPAAQAS
jgi:hypothetical protein